MTGLYVDSIKDASNTKTLATLSSSAVTLDSSVTAQAGSGFLNKIVNSSSSSAVSLVAFDNTKITTSHKYYMVVINYIRPTTNAKNLYLGMSDDNGSSFISAFYGSTEYYQLNASSVNNGLEAFQNTAYHQVFTSAGNLANSGQAGVIHLYATQNTNTIHVKTVAECVGKHSSDLYMFKSQSTNEKTETDTINYIKLYYESSDTVAEHDVTLYGVS